MRQFSKKRLEQMDNYQEIRNEIFSTNEQLENDQEVAMELAALKEMQESISKEVAAFMADKKIGIVKLTEILHSSTRQTNRIMNAEANVTLATIASIAQVMGKKAKITFE